VCVSESLLLCTYLSYIRLFFDATIIMVNKDFQTATERSPRHELVRTIKHVLPTL